MRRLIPIVTIIASPAIVALLSFAVPAKAQTPLRTALSADALSQTPALVVDIRRPEEWVGTGVLPNARLLTFDDPAAFVETIRAQLAPGQPVMLVCRTGNRTAQAARLIAPHLDVPVIDVAGGMVRLINEGFLPAAPLRTQGCTIC